MNKLNHKTTRSRKKQLLFKAIAAILPIMLLLLFETALRLIGYGFDLSLFVEDEKDKSCWVMNQHASLRYFTDKENATIGAFESFKKRKSADTYRIFVLGESTTIGYPYMHNASFHQWLSYRLMHTFPNRNFEIINLSLTAVNSYTVLGFAKEVINFEPDAVLIYCGQNEYYGTLGAGSTSRLGTNRTVVQTMIYLRNFRLVQLLSNGIVLVKKALRGKETDTRETLMKRMAAKQEIPFNSPTYQRGISQFQTNMEKVCEVFSINQIPAFISNLVSNEKDMKPFISSEHYSAFSANHQFEQAKGALENGEYAKAKQHFIQAKDFDLLRFRAPEAINQIIESLPAKYPSVFMVDTRKIFEENSPHGIIGKETILEHVHPTIFGYGLMSEAFYRAMKKHGAISPGNQNEISFDQLRHHMPITQVDSLKGTYEIQVLKEAWPFCQGKIFEPDSLKTFEEKLALALLNYKINWNDATEKLMQHYLDNHDLVNATKVAESAALEFSNDETFLQYAGKFCTGIHQNEKAKTYYQHAFRLKKGMETAQALAILYLKSDEPEKALAYLNFLKGNNHSQINYSVAQNLTAEVADCKKKLAHDPLNVDLLNKIAQNYFKMQNVEVATKYAHQVLATDTRNKAASDLLKKIESITAAKN
jgi:hypothetical protein